MSGQFNIDREAVARLGGLGTQDIVDGTAASVLANMKRLVPTDTTALHDSLGIETAGEGEEYVAKVGVDKHFTKRTSKGVKHPDEYWEHVERGTSKAPAQPFIEKALAQAQVAK